MNSEERELRLFRPKDMKSGIASTTIQTVPCYNGPLETVTSAGSLLFESLFTCTRKENFLEPVVELYRRQVVLRRLEDRKDLSLYITSVLRRSTSDNWAQITEGQRLCSGRGQ